MLIRATTGDSTALAAIHAASFPPHEAWGPDVFDLQLSLPNVFGVREATSGLILVRIAADEAEILTLAIVPAARRRGHARALLLEAASIAVTNRARTIFLEVSVANIAARTLYTGFGFVPAGRRPRYYSDGSDALLLRLDLAAAE